MNVQLKRILLLGLIGAVVVITSACAPPSLEVFFSQNPTYNESSTTYPKPLQRKQEPVQQPVSPTSAVIAQTSSSFEAESRLGLQMNAVLREAEAHVRAGEARMREQNPLEAIREFERARLLIEQDVDPILQYIDQQTMTQGGVSTLSTSRIQQFQNQRITMLARVNQAYNFRTMYEKQQQVEKINALRKTSQPALKPVSVQSMSPTEVPFAAVLQRKPVPVTPDPRLNWLSADDITPQISRLQQRQTDFRHCLLRANQYFPQITSILFAEGVPEILAYVALIESCYQPSAKSSSGKAGLWQLSASVARSYGLVVNSRNDERLHITLATRAFARYISDLHNRFRSWELAIMAYGVGEKALQNTIDRVGSHDPQVLKERIGTFSTEMTFLARVAAGMVIAKNPKAYGFDVDLPNISSDVTTQAERGQSSASSIVTLEPPVVLNY